MAYIVETIVSSPLTSYQDLLEFETAVRDVSDPDVDNIINNSLANGDLENYTRVASEDATNYYITSVFTWKDEATYLTATNDPSIADNQSYFESNFNFIRNLP